MPGSHFTPHVAQCEDYDSDDSEARPETRKAANVAVRRISQSLTLGKPEEKVKPGSASDSGYSSHTNGTIGSVGSAPHVKEGRAASSEQIPKSPADSRPAVPDATRGTSRPILGTRVLRRPPESRRSVEEDDSYGRCNDPRCNDCLGTNQNRATPMDSSLHTTYPQFVPPGYFTPPSPQLLYYPSPYPQFAPSGRPPEPRRRPLSVSVPRPVTYHPGMPHEGYWNPVYPASTERGTRQSPVLATYPKMSMPGAWPVIDPTPPATNADPATAQLQQWPMSPVETSRSPLVPWSPDFYSPRARPISIHGQTNASFDTQQAYPIYSQPVLHQQSSSGYNHVPFPSEMAHHECDCDSCTMPPPQLIPGRQATVPFLNTMQNQSSRSGHWRQSSDTCRCLDCDPEATIRASAPRQRPRLADSPVIHGNSQSTKVASSQHPADAKREVPLDNRGSTQKVHRRSSYAGHERKKQIERERDVEAYQDRNNGGKTNAQLTAEALMKASRRMARAIDEGKAGSNSHVGGSRRGSSRASKTSSVKVSKDGEAEGFKIRIGGTDLEFSGDMEVRLRSGKHGGETEVVIGSARREIKYPKEGGEAQSGRSEGGKTSEERRRGRSNRRRESGSRSVVGRVNGELP